MLENGPTAGEALHTRPHTLLALAALAFACSSGHPAPDAAQSDSPPSDAGTPIDPPPVIVDPPPPPFVEITAPSRGAMVAGAVVLAASAPDRTARVDFQVDGAVIATSSAPPFAATWDTFAAANGSHALIARAVDGAGAALVSAPVDVEVGNHIRNVFVILLENRDWASIKGSASAPYINGTLLALGAHAEKYMNVPGLHPSLPNYIWLEAGSTLGIADDAAPAYHLLSTTDHLVAQLRAAGVSWKSYQEDIPGTDCPLTTVNNYAPKHNPMVYFADVNTGLDRQSAECIAHVRPYPELARDLETDAVAAYSFITPNLCNDMHDCGIAAGDAWLSGEVPRILASPAYKRGGALLVAFDESEGSDVPIGLIVLSPLAKPGYSNQIVYTHSSTLRTLQEIFAVGPFLGDAANATDLRDLFRSFP